MSNSTDLPKLATRRDIVDGYEIFSRSCQDAGHDRPPVVLVHGLSMSSRYMVPTARRLAREYRVYAPDLPGYGESQKPRLTLDVDELAHVLRDWMDAMQIGPAVLLGNSMGCQIIITLAAEDPQRVLAAVLVGPTMDPSAVHLPKLFARAIHNMLFEPVSFYPILIHDYLEAGVRETFRALENAIRDPIQRKLARVAAPTLVVRGEHDQLVTQPWAEQVTRLLPRGQSRVIPGGAHVANYDAADELVRQVKGFLGHA